jgi:anti-sigma factor RsiW
MTCREVIDFLAGYLDGDLPPEQRVAFDEHLTVCPFCRNYLASYRKTIELEKQAFAASDAPPDESLPAELIQAVQNARRNSLKN